jgi:hypothetical protein
MIQKGNSKALLLVVAAVIVSIAYILLHLRFLQRFIDYDPITYVQNISSMLKYPSYRVFNAHHLHFEIGGVYFHRFMTLFFGEAGFDDLVFNLRLRSILVSGLGLFSMILLVATMTGRMLYGFSGGLFFSFTHGVLLYSAKIDTGIFPAAWLPLLLFVLYKLFTCKKWYIPLSMLSGLFLFAGVLLHQYMILVIIPVAFSLILPRRIVTFFRRRGVVETANDKDGSLLESSWKRRLVSMLLVSTTALILSITIYLYIGFSVYNLPVTSGQHTQARGPFKRATFQSWIMGYATLDTWGNGLSEFDARDPVRGLTDSFLSQRRKGPKFNRIRRFSFNFSDFFARKSFVYNVIALFWLVTLLGVILFFPVLMTRYGRIFIVIALCMGIFTLFAAFWEAYYLEFWLVPLVFIMLSGLMVINCVGEWLSQVTGRFAFVAMYSLIAVLLFLVSMHNIQYYLIPYSTTVIKESTGQWDNKDGTPVYLDYFDDSFYINPENPFIDIK